MSISLAALRNGVKDKGRADESSNGSFGLAPASISLADLRSVSQAELNKSKRLQGGEASNRVTLGDLKMNLSGKSSTVLSLSQLKKSFQANESTTSDDTKPLDKISLENIKQKLASSFAANDLSTEIVKPVSITTNIKKNCEAIKSEIVDKVDADFRAKHAVYFKMAKLGIPLPNIEQKLMLDQVDKVTMEQIFEKLGGSLTSSVFFPSKESLKEATSLSRIKLQRLHWKPLDSTNLSASSLWASVAKVPTSLASGKKKTGNVHADDDDGDDDDSTVVWNNVLSPEDAHMILNDLTANLDDYELNEVEFFFGIDTTKGGKKKGEMSETSKINKLHLPKVLDLQRAMNVAIGLSTFKNVARMRHVLNGVCSLNGLGGKLTPDKLLNLTSMLPTLQEAKSLQSAVTVNKGEVFCKLAMEYYPHLSGRLSCFLTVISFEEIYQSVIPKLKIFIKSIESILNSSNLALIFTKILAIGNALNAGTAMGEAAGFSLDSLMRTMSLKGGADRKMSVLDLSIKILREKGFLDILDVVHDLGEAEEACKLSPDNIFSEISTFNEEYEELNVELKNAQNYLTLYYQGALDSWLQSVAPGSTYVIKEDDMVTSCFGAGIVKEVRASGILKIRPSHWNLINEVEHMMYIHKDDVRVRAPFVKGDEVLTRHGSGVIEEVRMYDSVAVIRPATWGSSASSTPLVYEPIVTLRHQQKRVLDKADTTTSESDMPTLTLMFIDKLKTFLRSSNKKRKEVNKLKNMMGEKIQDLANYFGEQLHDDGITYVSETFEILKLLRHSLIKSYKIGPKKEPVVEPRVSRVKVRKSRSNSIGDDAMGPAAVGSKKEKRKQLVESVTTSVVVNTLRHFLRATVRAGTRRRPSFRYSGHYPHRRLTQVKIMMDFCRNFCEQNPVQRILSLLHFRALTDYSSSSSSSDDTDSSDSSDSSESDSSLSETDDSSDSDSGSDESSEDSDDDSDDCSDSDSSGSGLRGGGGDGGGSSNSSSSSEGGRENSQQLRGVVADMTTLTTSITALNLSQRAKREKKAMKDDMTLKKLEAQATARARKKTMKIQSYSSKRKAQQKRELQQLKLQQSQQKHLQRGVTAESTVAKDLSCSASRFESLQQYSLQAMTKAARQQKQASKDHPSQHQSQHPHKHKQSRRSGVVEAAIIDNEHSPPSHMHHNDLAPTDLQHPNPFVEKRFSSAATTASKKRKNIKIKPYSRNMMSACAMTPMEAQAMKRYANVTADDSDSDSDSDEEHGVAVTPTERDVLAGLGVGLFMSMNELDALLLPELNFTLPPLEIQLLSSSDDTTSQRPAPPAVTAVWRKIPTETHFYVDIEDIRSRRDSLGEDSLTSFELEAVLRADRLAVSNAHPTYEGVEFASDVEKLLNHREKHGEDALMTSEIAALQFYATDIEACFERVVPGEPQDDKVDDKISNSIHSLLQKMAMIACCEPPKENSESSEPNWDIMNKYQHTSCSSTVGSSIDQSDPLDRAKSLLAMMQAQNITSNESSPPPPDQSNWDIMSKYQDSGASIGNGRLDAIDRAKNLLAMMAQGAPQAESTSRSPPPERSNWDIMSKYQDTSSTEDDLQDPMARAQSLLAMMNTLNDTAPSPALTLATEDSNWDIMSKYQDAPKARGDDDDLNDSRENARRILAMMQHRPSSSSSLSSSPDLSDTSLTSDLDASESTEVSLSDARDTARRILALLQSTVDQVGTAVDAHGKNDDDSESTSSPPTLPDVVCENLTLDSIHARISAEIAMKKLDSLLTLSDDDREKEERAHEIMRRIDLERDLEVEEVMRRLHPEEVEEEGGHAHGDHATEVVSATRLAIEEMVKTLNDEAAALSASLLHNLNSDNDSTEEEEDNMTPADTQRKREANDVMERMEAERKRALQDLLQRLEDTKTVYPFVDSSTEETEMPTGRSALLDDDDADDDDGSEDIDDESASGRTEFIPTENALTSGLVALQNERDMSDEDEGESCCDTSTDNGAEDADDQRLAHADRMNTVVVDDDDSGNESGDCGTEHPRGGNVEASAARLFQGGVIMNDDSSDDDDSDDDNEGVDNGFVDDNIAVTNIASKVSSMEESGSSSDSDGDGDSNAGMEETGKPGIGNHSARAGNKYGQYTASRQNSAPATRPGTGPGPATGVRATQPRPPAARAGRSPMHSRMSDL